MMRKLIVSEYITVDGVMEDPGGGEYLPYGGWSVPYWNKEAEEYKKKELFNSDTLLLGRLTYEGFAAAWPSMTDNTGFADKMNTMPKYVISSTLSKATWENTTIIDSGIVEKVIELKQQDGKDILVFGSGQLISLLQENNLIDEYRLMIHPIIVGNGKRLFDHPLSKNEVDLKEVDTFKTGITVLTYSKKLLQK